MKIGYWFGGQMCEMKDILIYSIVDNARNGSLLLLRIKFKIICVVAYGI